MILGALVAGCSTGESDDAADAARPAPSAVTTDEPVRILVETWRAEDTRFWESAILPVFEAANPDIDVVMAPSSGPDYESELATRLRTGLAGDVITCRPFKQSLDLYRQGYLAPLDPALVEAFDQEAVAAWADPDDGRSFCVPAESVMHGFAYNTEIFDELGLEAPSTTAEFRAVLDAVAVDGRYAPLAFGTGESWVASTMGTLNIGPTYWGPDSGPLGLDVVDEQGVPVHLEEALEALASWRPYMPAGWEALTVVDIETLFISGQAAVVPLGSWQLAKLNESGDVPLGVFPPPLARPGQRCQVVDHIDLGFGMNSSTPHPEAVQRFLAWVSSAEFAKVYADALPGFFPLTDVEITYDDEDARTMVEWRELCDTASRSGAELSFDLEPELWDISVAVLANEVTPDDGARQIKDLLDPIRAAAEAPS